MAKAQWDELPCPKCAELIKAAASRCKHCGHEMDTEEVEARKKQGVARQSVGAGCAFLVVSTFILALCSGGGDDTEDPARSAEDRQKGFHCLSGWDGSHRGFVEQVKSTLRDPESFEHDETLVTPNVDGRHSIIMSFRARNGFGGMNAETAIGTFDHVTCEATYTPI